jgi:ribosome assembly protein 1
MTALLVPYISHLQTFSLFRDKERVEKIVQSLNLKISARDSRHSDSRAHLQAIFHQWLPLSRTVLQMVVEKLPSPLEISSERIEKLMCGGLRSFESLPDKTRTLKHGACEFSRKNSQEKLLLLIYLTTIHYTGYFCQF